MTAPTSGLSEIGLNFKLSRVQLSSAGIGSGYNKSQSQSVSQSVRAHNRPAQHGTALSPVKGCLFCWSFTQLYWPTWSWDLLAAVRLTEEGTVRGLLQEDGLGILEEKIGQQYIIK